MYETKFHQNDLSEFTFLITGGAGFVGSNIVEYLLKYNAKEVRVLDNLSTGFLKNIEAFQSLSNFKFIEGDITDYATCIDATKGVDYISHQAALGSVPRSIENPVATNKSNIDGFLNVATAARENGVKRMVYASSSSVYGNSPELPKVEAEIGQPLSPYAVTKLCNELYASVFADVYQQEIIGLRYFNIFGPRQSPEGAYAAVIPLFIEALNNSKSPMLNGDGKQSRDFTFVENAVQANIKALFTEKSEAFGEAFNVALNEEYDLLQLVEFLQKIIGNTTPPKHREDRLGDIRNSLADISKAKNLLDYQPMIRFQEGLKITVDWFNS